MDDEDSKDDDDEKFLWRDRNRIHTKLDAKTRNLELQKRGLAELSKKEGSQFG